MNWDRIEDDWKQIKDKVKVQWDRLTDDQLDTIAGKRDHLVGTIQATYGISRHAAEWQLSRWHDSLERSQLSA